MTWFKTKREQNRILLEKLEHLNNKYSDYKNSYCKIGDYIFIFKGFEILDNKIYINYIDKNTPENMYNRFEYYWWNIKYDVDIIKARNNWLNFKHTLKQLGLKIEVINV